MSVQLLLYFLLLFVGLRCVNNAINAKLLQFLCRTFCIIIFCYMTTVSYAETYPVRCRVTNTLNVRSGPGTNYSKIGKLYPNSYIIVNSTTYRHSRQWGEIDYNNRIGYVAMQYVSYQNPIELETTTSQTTTTDGSVDTLDSIVDLFGGIWKIVRICLLALMVILLLAFWKNIVEMLVFLGLSYLVGALVSHLLFDNGELGGVLGLSLGIFIGLRKIVDNLGTKWSDILWLAYLIISAPLFWSNRLQHVLTEPWRYMFKTSWLDDAYKAPVRNILRVVQFLLYVATTPLRLFNAIGYNIFVYIITELYDLMYEVLQPCSEDEGAGNLWMWLVMLPYRFFKYPIYHGGQVIIEGVVWTVVDIFIPAVTMYHGTDLTAGQMITSCSERNQKLKRNAQWTQGTFAASHSSWDGIGVYFASSRRVAITYAHCPYRLGDNNPIMIVCRVSLGNIINYALAPYHVYSNAGQYGNPAVLNKYGEKEGYTTGEWWNERGGYWEYCMFDWQNRYNHSWRIRPVYVFNFRTSKVQHINGGMRHWLFDSHVAEDILKSIEKSL